MISKLSFQCIDVPCALECSISCFDVSCTALPKAAGTFVNSKASRQEDINIKISSCTMWSPGIVTQSFNCKHYVLPASHHKQYHTQDPSLPKLENHRGRATGGNLCSLRTRNRSLRHISLRCRHRSGSSRRLRLGLGTTHARTRRGLSRRRRALAPT